jgi:hypothetical protein
MYLKVGEDGKKLKSYLNDGKWVLTPICRRTYHRMLALSCSMCSLGVFGYLTSTTNHDRAQALLIIVLFLAAQVGYDHDILRGLPKHEDVHKDLMPDKK